jgi:pimeloyl-ACP methyl ester carboxylesterase
MNLLSEIKVPIMIIPGESDIPDVHAHIGVIQAGIAGSRRVVLNHSGHLAHFEVPDVFQPCRARVSRSDPMTVVWLAAFLTRFRSEAA